MQVSRYVGGLAKLIDVRAGRDRLDFVGAGLLGGVFSVCFVGPFARQRDCRSCTNAHTCGPQVVPNPAPFGSHPNYRDPFGHEDGRSVGDADRVSNGVWVVDGVEHEMCEVGSADAAAPPHVLVDCRAVLAGRGFVG